VKMIDLGHKRRREKMLSIQEIVIQMWQNDHTATEIAVYLNRTRQEPHTRASVMGRVHRMQKKGILNRRIPESSFWGRRDNSIFKKASNLESFSVDIEKIEAVKVNKKFIPNRTFKKEHILAKQSKHTPYVPRLEEDVTKGTLFLVIKNSQCKWIYDFERSGQKVCCGEKAFKKSYCREHYFMCYNPIPSRKSTSPHSRP